MLFTILGTLLILAVVGVIVYESVDGGDVGYIVGAAAATLTIGIFAGGLLLLLGGVAIDMSRDDEGWALQKESVYTVAEDASVVVNAGVIEFVAVMGGAPHTATVPSGHQTFVQTTEGPRTVTVREEFREVGTAIFPWGEGDTKITSYIK